MIALSVDGTTLISVSVLLLVWVSISGLQSRCSATSATEAVAVPVGDAVNMVRKNGQHIIFPVNPLYTHPLPQRTLEITRKYELAVLKKLRKFAPTILDRAPSVLHTVRWLRLGLELRKISSDKAREVKKYGVDTSVDERMQVQFRTMLAKLKIESRTLAKKFKLARKPKNYKETTRMANEVADILIDIYTVSPVAGFLDWEEGKVNGQRFTDLVLAMMTNLRHNGYDAPMEYFMRSLTLEDDKSPADKDGQLAEEAAPGATKCS